jgi:glycosyltransferase involved in cell wall biosynthesis
MKIAIDARIIYTSTGRPVERLLHYLQTLDTKNEYRVMTARHIITPTDYVRQGLIFRYKADPSKITRTYEAVDNLSDTIIPYPPMKDKRFILFVGNAYAHKNLPRLVDAFSMANLSDTHLLFVGKANLFYERLQDYIDHQQVKNVHVRGFAEDAELVWLYQHAALFVTPSLSEGFCIPGLEAMKYGTPVVSSNATCLPEVYGKAAVYFNPTDTKEMAKVIKDTLANKALLDKLKKAGREHVKQFSWKRMAEQTLEVYQKSLLKR